MKPKQIELVYAGRRMGDGSRVFHLFYYGKREAWFRGRYTLSIGSRYEAEIDGKEAISLRRRPLFIGDSDTPVLTVQKWEALDAVVDTELREKREAKKVASREKKLDPIVKLLVPICEDMTWGERTLFIDALVRRVNRKTRSVRI